MLYCGYINTCITVSELALLRECLVVVNTKLGGMQAQLPVLALCNSVPSGPGGAWGAWGPSGGLLKALDGTGQLSVVRPGQSKCRTIENGRES